MEISGVCTVRFGTSAVRKESGDRPEKDRMRGQPGAVRQLGQDRVQAEDEKGGEAKRQTDRERGRKKVKET